MKVKYSSGADHDIAAALEYYGAIRVSLGSDFLLRLRAATDLIQHQPNAGKLLGGERDLRELQIQRFPYRIIYRLENDTAEILTVYHHKRRVGSWGWRIQDEPAVYQLVA